MVAALTNGQVVHAGDLNGVGFRVHLAGTQSIPNSTETVLKFDSIDEDPDGGYTASTGTYRIGSAGLWVFGAMTCFASNSTGVRGLIIRGTAEYWASSFEAADDAFGRFPLTTGPTRCALGALINIGVSQNSSAALNVDPSNGSVIFTGARVAA